MILVSRLLRTAIGAIFLAAGIGKLLDDHRPRLAPVLLGDTSGAIVIASAIVEDALPALEILAGLAAWAGIGRRARIVLGLLLGAAFLAAAAALPPGARCGCFGVLGDFEGRGAHAAASAAFLGALVAEACLQPAKNTKAASPCRGMGYDSRVASGFMDPT